MRDMIAKTEVCSSQWKQLPAAVSKASWKQEKQLVQSAQYVVALKSNKSHAQDEHMC